MEEKDIEKRILEIVPPTGKSVGNKFLLTELKKTFKGLDIDTFWKVRNNLLENGKLGKGKGKGGSVYSIVQTAIPIIAETEKGKKRRISENELYEPVHKVLKDAWAKDNRIDDYLTEVTQQSLKVRNLA